MADWLKDQNADAAVLAALDSIAWTFNVRGKDVEHTPVALSFALVRDDGTADLFVDSEKIGDDVRQHLGNGVRLHEQREFEAALAELAGKTVLVDPERSVAAIFEALDKAGAKIVAKRDPAVLPKAIKNVVEISGHRAAQARDGAALSSFLHWLSIEAPKGHVDELKAADRLQRFRQQFGDLRDLSFDTISGAGPNGAIVHYRVNEETNRPIEMDSLYLVDSGGQYPDGTTDVTRTVAIGTPTAEMRDRFTRVLKGHIAVGRARFPDGTRGSQLDSFARQYLWEVGLDYAHGTGHGVGSFLAVHEGPQRIAPVGSGQAGGDEPLRAGMILSNEPGYYKTGEYGIRVENLVLVVPAEAEGAEKKLLGFETLTFAPIDRSLIDLDLLGDADRRWVDDYHAEVLRIVGPQLEGEARAWLEAACAAL
jgi:Xaa-Pro aminopeptidase